MRLSAFLLTLVLATSVLAQSDPALIEKRYCGPPPRSSTGTILRRSDTIYYFRKNHPCPATQSTTGACPGWAIDHVIPLACGGCDAVWNMQWLPLETKSAATPVAKDRWERLVYPNKSVYNGPECQPKIVTK